jgi:molybdate transport system ATP-binding protein
LENVFDVTLTDSDIRGGRSRVRLESGQELFVSYTPGPPHRLLQIGIRGDDILLATKEPEGVSAGNLLRGVIRNIETAEGQSILRVEAGALFYVRLTRAAVETLGLRNGGDVFLIIKARSCVIL